MKKSLLFISLTVGAMMLPGVSLADGWGHHHGHGHGHRHHHDHHVDYYAAPEVRYYYPQPVVSYYAPPPPAVVYQAPPPPPPVSYYPGGRPSTNGLAGGVIGSALGYQFGSGDPLAAGVGAAAGSYLGNGFGGY